MASVRALDVPRKTSKRKWIFSKEEMANMASLREGMDEFRELQFRQQSTAFIKLLGDRLNVNLKDPRFKITQLCMCAAMIHMHRFFYFHSFTFFDYRDVAAACLFLSGKSEECPRKIDYVVRAWWEEKFPGVKLDQQKYEDAMGLLVMIEGIVLQTIDFDLQVSLPHPLVLKVMHAIATNDRKITGVVYFFSTDVLCVTSWGIRYSAEAIAVACVHIVCAWANYAIPASADGSKWYHKTDPTMTEEQLLEMQREFISIYRACKSNLAITTFLKRLGESENRLPAPPPPPNLSLDVKKIKKEEPSRQEYKQDRRLASGDDSRFPAGSDHKQQLQQSQSQQPRRNFMPDLNTANGASVSMRGFVEPKKELSDRKPEIKREDPSFRSAVSSQRPSRPPSNGSSGAPSSQNGWPGTPPPRHIHHPQQHHSSSQNPYANGDRSMDRSSSMGGERERNEKRKRETSGSGYNSDKRSRTDSSMSNSSRESMRGGYSTMPSSSSLQQSQGSYNSVPPPLMRQPIQSQQHGSSSSKLGPARGGAAARKAVVNGNQSRHGGPHSDDQQSLSCHTVATRSIN